MDAEVPRVALGSYSDSLDAELACGRLQAEGIAAEFARPDRRGPWRISVPEGTAQRARALLADDPSERLESLFDELPASPAEHRIEHGRCPRCGSGHREDLRLRPSLLRDLLRSFSGRHAPWGARWLCRACAARWR